MKKTQCYFLIAIIMVLGLVVIGCNSPVNTGGLAGTDGLKVSDLPETEDDGTIGVLGDDESEDVVSYKVGFICYLQSSGGIFTRSDIWLEYKAGEAIDWDEVYAEYAKVAYAAPIAENMVEYWQLSHSAGVFYGARPEVIVDGKFVYVQPYLNAYGRYALEVDNWNAAYANGSAESKAALSSLGGGTDHYYALVNYFAGFGVSQSQIQAGTQYDKFPENAGVDFGYWAGKFEDGLRSIGWGIYH